MLMNKIIVNGKEYRYEIDQTVADLLRDLKLPQNGLAVVINDEIVPRKQLYGHRLQDGDRIEIIRAIGGG